jgi:hypothetical protein
LLSERSKPSGFPRRQEWLISVLSNSTASQAVAPKRLAAASALASVSSEEDIALL